MSATSGPKFMTGPCIVCGRINYPLSYGGPSICPSCDCGINPELDSLRQRLKEAEEEKDALIFAAEAGLYWSLEPMSDESCFTPEFKKYVDDTRATIVKAKQRGRKVKK